VCLVGENGQRVPEHCGSPRCKGHRETVPHPLSAYPRQARQSSRHVRQNSTRLTLTERQLRRDANEGRRRGSWPLFKIVEPLRRTTAGTSGTPGQFDMANAPPDLTTGLKILLTRMQTELLDRKRWRTRLELANAIFEYLEIFHNRQRRHSSLGMLTPIEYERLYVAPNVA
jgi:hypothetical protein